MGVVYSITNTINDRIYIGITTNKYPNTRWSAHKNNASKNKKHPLYRAMNKYGVDNFSFNILDRCDNDKLGELECEYIEKYNTVYPNGYNLTIGGECLFGENNPSYGKPSWNKGIPRTEELKQLLRKKSLERYALHPEIKLTGSKNPMYGKVNPFKGMKHTRVSIIQNRLSQPNRKEVQFVHNDITINMPSLGATAEWVRNNTTYKKADYTTIRKSIINNWKCYGYKFNWRAQ